ncbi:zinc finger protein 22-like isoform X2 [Trichoplusia ni]|uniref:Zinc finger protein 22-like isoform X2 n=1 Tax=Trichoplusia ni TaxID=7111 RepID=A0A7E5WUM2_TRINI|nr:zinc finger protein 22-like isoform X2 [Trichoplusia ni]
MAIELKKATSDSNKSQEITSLVEYCRVCTTRSKNMSYLFGPGKKNIVDKIYYCTGVRLKNERDLPTHICPVCLTHLTIACKFKTSCLEADGAFRSLVINTEIKIKEWRLILDGFDDDILVKQEFDVDLESDDDREETILPSNEDGLEEILDQSEILDESAVTESEKDTVAVNGVDGVEKSNAIGLKKDGISTPLVRGRPKKTDSPRRLRKYKFKKLWCEPCNIKFDTKEQSAAHKREQHKDSETWVCEVCGKMFVHRASHYTHVKSHQPPQYACDTCDYKTWHKYDLVKHIRIHTGHKMYQCEYCTASYYTSSNLRSHIRRNHMHQRPHECNICRRTFFDRTKLNRHVDSHLEIKRFECEVCHACFTRRCYWKKHLLRQHDVITPPQRPGRQKINLVIGEYLVQSKQDELGMCKEKV